MSTAAALMRAVLAEHAQSEAEALAHLEAALTLDVDPLAYCAHRFSLGECAVMERAAAWARLAFSKTVPPTVRDSSQFKRLDSLASIRTLRATLFDREVLYSSPKFSHFVQLRSHAEAHPDFRRCFCVVPESALRTALASASAGLLLDEARQRLARRWPRASGNVDLSRSARVIFVLCLVALVAAAALAPFLYKPVFLPLVGFVLVAPAILRLVAVFQPQRPDQPPPLLDDAALPTYSVLVPLRDEAHMVPLLWQALSAIDYPPEKLDIKFVVESRSGPTIAAVQRIVEDPRFALVVVPDAAPHTKPKALNYAMPLVRGEHVVIYDAEDIPDRGQLRLVASQFAERPEIDCLQAELVIDNAGENLLTALFAGEYAGQFGLVLPLLARLRLPMPLGGTSNHFRVRALREVGGWDAFNVTEDADLGVRLL